MQRFARDRTLMCAWILYIAAAAADQVPMIPAAPLHDAVDLTQSAVSFEFYFMPYGLSSKDEAPPESEMRSA